MEDPTLKQVCMPSLKEVAVHEEHMQEQELWPQGTQSGAHSVEETHVFLGKDLMLARVR